MNKKGFKHGIREVVHSQISYTEKKSLNKFLDFSDSFWECTRIFLSEQPFDFVVVLPQSWLQGDVMSFIFQNSCQISVHWHPVRGQ